jgi:hypothetical protein
MKQYRYTSEHFVQQETVPDAYISHSDLAEIQRLAGLQPPVESMPGINISTTGMEKQRLEREHNIKPGTPEWFKLWFSLPYMTGEKPIK